jgi:hypothetical protein
MTEVTGGELLTLWKVGRIELPKIAQVYLDAIDGLAAARGAAAAFFQRPAAEAPETTAGQVGPAWLRVCDELTETLSLCARNTLAAGDAVGRAITEHTRTDADGTGSPTEPGQDLWRMIHDPNEIDPADPDQNPARQPAVATQADDHTPASEGPGRQPAESGYLPDVTRIAESVKRLVIDKQKTDEKAFSDFATPRFQQYSEDVKASWEQWARAYNEWSVERHSREPATASGPPQRPPATRDSALMATARAEYEKYLEDSYHWIVPAFQAWAAHGPDRLTPAITAAKAVEDRLGDGQAVRFANSAQINLASQWDGSYCTNLRNFLASFLVMPGNQQTIARTLRELLEAEQALYRQAQGNMLQLAEKAEEAIKACGTENRPETRTFLTILSAVTWIAGAALAIPSGGASIYAGVVTFNALAAVSGAAASLLPGGDEKSIGADRVDDVLENVSRVMREARTQIATREQDIVTALEHNHQTLAAVRQRSTVTGTAGPVTPSQPTIIGAEAGEISAHLHPK